MGKHQYIFLVVICGLCLMVSLVCMIGFQSNGVLAEEADEECVFKIGGLGFKYYDEIDQPMPKIMNGKAVQEYATLKVGDFYLANRPVKYQDFPEFFDSLNLSEKSVNVYGFSSLSVQLFLRHINAEMAPELKKNALTGTFVLPNWRELIRVNFAGEKPGRVHSDSLGGMLANRYFEKLCWSGEDSILPIGGVETRRGFLMGMPSLQSFAWPSNDENEQRIFNIRHGEGDYSKKPVWAPVKMNHHVLLKFQPKAEGGR